MFETSPAGKPGTSAGGAEDVLDAPTLAGWAAVLANVDKNATDAERIDQIRELEVLKCAAEVRQAVLTADFDASQRAEQARAGVPARQQGRGVAAQVAPARRESPHKGQQHLGLAKILPTELPHTLAAFTAGHITEWRAMLVGRETACLSLADRRAVDEALAADPERLAAMGDRALVGEARKLAYRLDPGSFVERRQRAEGDRAVTIRPAPDTMCYLTELLPVAQGVAVYAALRNAADSARAGGDRRGRGQIMADTLVERVTGQTSADEVPLRVNLGSATTSSSERTATPTSRGSVRYLATWLATWWPRAGRSGCAGSTPGPPPDSWWRWNPAPGPSPRGSGSSSTCVTRPAARLGATPRSVTTTTPGRSKRTARPVLSTARVSAKPATTPSRRAAGPRVPDRARPTRS
jgi:hypothetical protein